MMHGTPFRNYSRDFDPQDDEIIVDIFAGAGGASEGIEQATGHPIHEALNHNPSAMHLHMLNHPRTHHHCEDIEDADPNKICAGRPVKLLWLSPDCRFFSRARGGKPMRAKGKKSRALAWAAVRWAKAVRPRIIMMENVAEFQDWCVLTKDDLPDPNKKGQTFRRFISSLRNLGYTAEWRVLNAADYGAPTHRRRLFMIMRCDGNPIIWPEPTHGPKRALPWRTAAECIDFCLPCYSIFLSKEEARQYGVKRPLADKTMRRIAMGLKRYVIDNPKPFIVQCNHGRDEFRGQSIDQPLSTVSQKHGYGVVSPAFMVSNYGEAPHQETRGQKVDEPMRTVTPSNNAGVLVSPYMTSICQNGSNGSNTQDVERPLTTIVTKNEHCVIEPVLAPPANRSEQVQAWIAKHYGGVVGHEADRPLGTVTAKDHHSVAAAHLVKFRGDSKGSSMDAPLPTITSGSGAARPAGAPHAMAVCMTQFRGTNQGAGGDPAQPAPSLTAQGNHIGEVRAFITKYFGTNIGQKVDSPMQTQTSRHRFGLVMVSGEAWEIIDIGLRMLTPRELAKAQGFPDDYVLIGPNYDQVAKIGNSVPPALPCALVRANIVELAAVEVA